jgi:hypothetical protein
LAAPLFTKEKPRTAARNSKFKIQVGRQRKRFAGLEWVVYLRCAVLAQLLFFLIGYLKNRSSTNETTVLTEN